MAVDYDIDCQSQHYFKVKAICIILMLVWAVGIPLGLLWRMYLIKHLIPQDEVEVVRSLSNIGPSRTYKALAPAAEEQKKKEEEEAAVVAAVAAKTAEDKDAAAATVAKADEEAAAATSCCQSARNEGVHQYQKFQFVLGDYKRDFWYWEVVELSRKLILAGVIGLVQRGTIAQTVAATLISFIYFAASVWAQPFKSLRLNWIKIFSEFQLYELDSLP